MRREPHRGPGGGCAEHLVMPQPHGNCPVPVVWADPRYGWIGYRRAHQGAGYRRCCLSCQLPLCSSCCSATPGGDGARPLPCASATSTWTGAASTCAGPSHDLRHTAASLMIQAGYPPKMLQAIMGHASINNHARPVRTPLPRGHGPLR
ncbi:MAG: tyrosine-type recombinase/integrase [Streptosporangiaceae bacterium]